MAPLIMAPHIRPGLMSRLKARGSSTGATAVTEPVEVPQAVEISMQVRKAMREMRPVFSSSWATT